MQFCDFSIKRKQVFPFFVGKIKHFFLDKIYNFWSSIVYFVWIQMVSHILGHPIYIYIHVHIQYIITHTFIILLVAHLCMEWDALVLLVYIHFYLLRVLAYELLWLDPYQWYYDYVTGLKQWVFD